MMRFAGVVLMSLALALAAFGKTYKSTYNNQKSYYRYEETQKYFYVLFFQFINHP